MQSNHTNTFMTKHDCIYSKLFANKNGDSPIYGQPGVNYPIFDKNDPKYWYYANNFTIWTIWSCKVTTKIHSGQIIHSISSKLIAKHCGVTLYGHPGGQIRQWMYGCGYFVLSNMEGCRIIPIFGVNFGQNLVFDP